MQLELALVLIGCGTFGGLAAGLLISGLITIRRRRDPDDPPARHRN